MTNKVNKKISFSHILVYIILSLGSIIMLFPFVWMILTSFKTQAEAIRIPIQFFPSSFRIANYIQVFEKIPFSRMYINTILNTLIIVVVQLIICSMAAYAFARIKFPGKDILFGLLLSVLMIPASFFIIPQYLIIQKLGLLNTLVALFLPNLFSIFGTFLLRQFFMSLPKELEDAARIDGCNTFMIFTKIMLPLVRSGLIALGILVFRFAWNDLMWPMIVNTSAEKMTLAAGLSYMKGQFATDYPSTMAGSVMAVLPLLIVFVIFQKQFIEGIASQGIKG